MDAIAPFSEYELQNKERMITGQNVAAMPDQPNITNQNTVRSGLMAATPIETAKANRAMNRVTHREILPIFFSFNSGW